MKLKKLIERLDYTILTGDADIEVNALLMDSRKVTDGDVFVCITGAIRDAHDFLDDVCLKGAAAVIVEKNVDLTKAGELGVCVIRVASTRYALACMAAAYYGYPAEKLKTIGITGTKGKTTTTYMVRSVLEGVGIKCGLIGTIETIIGDGTTIPSENTTPESLLVQEYFARMVESGCQAVVMEVSSQGLMMDRVAGFTFDFGVFTNLSADHIGPNEHKDFDDYVSCKAKLFNNCRHGIFNVDDEHVNDMLSKASCDIETFGVKNMCKANESLITKVLSKLEADDVKLFTKPGVLGVSYNVSGKIDMPVEICVPGDFSVYNSLAAMAICLHFPNDKAAIEGALANIRVKGRVEIVPVKEDYTLMIDYAHNAMSLESLLKSLEKYEHNRIITLFGCGGNRDRNRRFEMGEISSRMSDLTVVTSDNPRDEEPMAIIEDIITGVKKADGEYVTIPDRKEAIKYAIEIGQKGDIIVLAGKGHEDYQIIKGTKYHMDERELIAEIKEELRL